MEEAICEFLTLLSDTELFLKRSADQYLSNDLERFLQDFRTKRVNPIYRRFRKQDEPRYVLSTVGLTNVGKSTLAHALLGHPVAPRRNGPATAIPVEYEFSHEWLIKTYSLGTQQIRTQSFESAAELSKTLEAKVFDPPRHKSSANQGIERIIVRGPMSLLEDGIVFADTPGFGAAQIESNGSSHEQALVDYLKEHVHEVMFCVSGAQAMVSNPEEEFFRAIQELCSTVIVTKWDGGKKERQAEMAKYREKFADLFPFCGFMFVEAKSAINGSDRASIEELQGLIRERATRENRIDALKDQLAKAWGDLHDLAREPLRKSGAIDIPWQRAALPRFLNSARRHGIPLNPSS